MCSVERQEQGYGRGKKRARCSGTENLRDPGRAMQPNTKGAAAEEDEREQGEKASKTRPQESRN